VKEFSVRVLLEKIFEGEFTNLRLLPTDPVIFEFEFSAGLSIKLEINPL